MVPIVPNGLVDETYGGYHISYEVKKLMYEKIEYAPNLLLSILLFGVVAPIPSQPNNLEHIPILSVFVMYNMYQHHFNYLCLGTVKQWHFIYTTKHSFPI